MNKDYDKETVSILQEQRKNRMAAIKRRVDKGLSEYKTRTKKKRRF